MTERREGMRIGISLVAAPDGSEAVLFQAAEWHVLLAPREALEVALAIAEVVIVANAEREAEEP